jgi:hypothetical protein
MEKINNNSNNIKSKIQKAPSSLTGFFEEEDIYDAKRYLRGAIQKFPLVIFMILFLMALTNLILLTEFISSSKNNLKKYSALILHIINTVLFVIFSALLWIDFRFIKLLLLPIPVIRLILNAVILFANHESRCNSIPIYLFSHYTNLIVFILSIICIVLKGGSFI